MVAGGELVWVAVPAERKTMEDSAIQNVAMDSTPRDSPGYFLAGKHAQVDLLKLGQIATNQQLTVVGLDI